MVNAPHASLKVIVIIQFILTVWASMMGDFFLGSSYIFMNAFTLLFGFWSIVNLESVDAVLMYGLLNLVNIFLDIIFLGVETGPAKEYFKTIGDRSIGQFRFALSMAVISLLLRPFISFILYRVYQDRKNQYGEHEYTGAPSFGGAPSRGYENIDQTVPPAHSGSP